MADCTITPIGREPVPLIAAPDTTGGAATAETSTDASWPTPLRFEQVLARARSREQEALSLLYRRFLPVVYRFLLARLSDVPLAEDLTSETFFAVLQGIASVRARDELGFATWVLGIARHKLSQHFRQRQRHPEIPLAHPEIVEPLARADADDPLMVMTARERWAEVVDALNHLTAEQRTVLLHRCILGHSADEVARLMGKPVNAVYGLQFRALAAMERLLTPSASPHSAPPRARGGLRERRDGHAARGEA